MKKILATLIIGLGSLSFAGCATKAGTGALTGSAIGFGFGSLAGGDAGAIIGAGTGAIAGSLIGSALDNDQKEACNQNIDLGEKLTVNDIIDLSDAGIPSGKIIGLIRKTHTHFILNDYQITKLRDSGVPKRVIEYMLCDT
ncbi:MAG: glycine zipper domain-containing protein [Chlamydiota bacterium]